MKVLAGSNCKPSCNPSPTTPFSSGSPKCPQHTWTNFRWSRKRLWGLRPVAIKKSAASHLRTKTGVLPPRANLERCSQQFYASALQPMHPSYLIVTSHPDLCPLRASLQASYHHILRGPWVRSQNPNASPLIFGGVLEEGTYLLARRLLRRQMIEEIVRSHSPNKVLMATLPPIDPVEQLLYWSYRSALSQLQSGYCLRLQSRPHLCQLLLHQPHGGLPLLLPYTFHGTHITPLGLYVWNPSR